MKLNDAIKTIMDFYKVEVEGDSVVAHATPTPPTSVEVWAAWTTLAKRTGRLQIPEKEDN
jgi:hypothetical protein